MTDRCAAPQPPNAAQPVPAEQELYRSDSLRVVARLGHGSAIVVVTFTSFADRPDPAGPGFGAAFLAGHALDAVHVICADNSWYQYDDMPLALQAVRAALPGVPVVTYGLSMGGFAAVNFSEALGAARVVAISPQYSVDPLKMPEETRWPAAQALRFPHDNIGRLQRQCPDVCIVYDDQNLDRLHVDRIRQGCNVRDVIVPFAGHPVTGFLTETRLLSALALDLILGRFDEKQFGATLRKAQAQSGIFLLQLREAVPRHRRRLRARLLQAAEAALRRQIADAPWDHDSWYHLARAAEAADRPHDAIAALRRYCARSDYLWGQLRLALLLLRHGPAEADAVEAETLLRLVRDAAPKHWDARLGHALALGRTGRLTEAETLLRQMVHERPISFAARAMLARTRRTRQPLPAQGLPRNRAAQIRGALRDMAADLAGRRRVAVSFSRRILCEYDGIPEQ